MRCKNRLLINTKLNKDINQQNLMSIFLFSKNNKKIWRIIDDEQIYA